MTLSTPWAAIAQAAPANPTAQQTGYRLKTLDNASGLASSQLGYRAGKHSDLRSVIAVFGPLGWRAIGGPAAHGPCMEREVVRKRHWLDRAEFGRLFAACNLMPGPGSTQLALLLGLRRAGIAGMLMAALLFIGPAVLIMLGLAELYRHVGANHQVQLVLLGVDAAVVGIVARAAVDLSLLS